MRSYDTTLSPIIDAIRVKRKNIRPIDTGSLNTNIPNSTVPTAPIPVHTAYAVPSGNVCDARARRYILKNVAAKNPAPHK